MDAAASNPLANVANSLPAHTLRAASIAGRIFGAGLAVLVAFDQSYDPTQVFTVLVALVTVATLVPLRGGASDAAAAFGAGVVFFSGTVLTHFETGIGMLAMGLLAGLAGFALAYRSGRDVTMPGVAFLAAAVVTGLLQAGIVFIFE